MDAKFQYRIYVVKQRHFVKQRNIAYDRTFLAECGLTVGLSPLSFE